MRQVITQDYGVPLDDIAKVNIKGRFQLWRRSTGELVEIPLKRMQQATREGCKLCPDFAAEHADVAAGGLGQRDGWTLAVVRTQRGEDWMAAEADGVITVRPGEEDLAALALMAKLAVRSRERWPAGLTGDRARPADAPGCADKRRKRKNHVGLPICRGMAETL